MGGAPRGFPGQGPRPLGLSCLFSSLESLHPKGPTGWTLPAAGDEFSLPRALRPLPACPAALPSLPCPREGWASSGRQRWGGLLGPLKHHPQPLPTWLAQVGKVRRLEPGVLEVGAGRDPRCRSFICGCSDQPAR